MHFVQKISAINYYISIYFCNATAFNQSYVLQLVLYYYSCYCFEDFCGGGGIYGLKFSRLEIFLIGVRP